jgi:hypothetical protein
MIFNKPSKYLKGKYKNKSKKLIRSEIVDMLSMKQDNISKDHLIIIHILLSKIN